MAQTKVTAEDITSNVELVPAPGGSPLVADGAGNAVWYDNSGQDYQILFPDPGLNTTPCGGPDGFDSTSIRVDDSGNIKPGENLFDLINISGNLTQGNPASLVLSCVSSPLTTGSMSLVWDGQINGWSGTWTLSPNSGPVVITIGLNGAGGSLVSDPSAKTIAFWEEGGFLFNDPNLSWNPSTHTLGLGSLGYPEVFLSATDVSGRGLLFETTTGAGIHCNDCLFLATNVAAPDQDCFLALESPAAQWLVVSENSDGAFKISYNTSPNPVTSPLYIGVAAPNDCIHVSSAGIVGLGNNNLQVNTSGDLIKIKNVSYSWPSAQAALSNYVLTNDGSGNLSWGPGGGGGGGGGTYSRVNATGNSATTVFTVPTYTLGNNALLVYNDGVLLTKTVDYAETSTTSITFTIAPVTGASLSFIVATAGAVGSLSGGTAGEVPYQAASGVTSFTSVGTTGQVLTSNGAGAPTWTTPVASAAGSSTQIQYNTGGLFDASFKLIWDNTNSQESILGHSSGAFTNGALSLTVYNGAGVYPVPAGVSLGDSVVSGFGAGNIHITVSDNFGSRPALTAKSTSGVTNVGIGTVTPSAFFSVGPSSQFSVDNAGNATAVSFTGPLTGNVTGSASAVAGITVSGTPSTSQILTATSSTTANWQAPAAPAAAGSTGAVQFNSAGSLAADTTNFFWNNTSKALGIGTSSPNAAAIVDLTSTTQGFLPPRMTTTQRDAIASPPSGLIIYNITTGELETFV